MTTNTTTATDAPRVRVGCLHCYNSGRLIGRWYPCTDAAEVDLEGVHADSRGPYQGCEELWCVDLENLPVRRKTDLFEPLVWGEFSTEVDDDLWPAVCAWVESGSHVSRRGQ